MILNAPADLSLNHLNGKTWVGCKRRQTEWIEFQIATMAETEKVSFTLIPDTYSRHQKIFFFWLTEHKIIIGLCNRMEKVERDPIQFCTSRSKASREPRFLEDVLPAAPKGTHCLEKQSYMLPTPWYVCASLPREVERISGFLPLSEKVKTNFWVSLAFSTCCLAHNLPMKIYIFAFARTKRTSGWPWSTWPWVGPFVMTVKSLLGGMGCP